MLGSQRAARRHLGQHNSSNDVRRERTADAARHFNLEHSTLSDLELEYVKPGSHNATVTCVKCDVELRFESIEKHFCHVHADDKRLTKPTIRSWICHKDGLKMKNETQGMMKFKLMYDRVKGVVDSDAEGQK